MGSGVAMNPRCADGQVTSLALALGAVLVQKLAGFGRGYRQSGQIINVGH
jgi:hypothetical protein